jgi:hypothetical protein
VIAAVSTVITLALWASPVMAMHVIGATVSGPSSNQTALVTIDGRPMPQTLRAAEIRFGRPASVAQKPDNSKLCVLHWSRLKLTGVFTIELSALTHACISEASTQRLTASGSAWRTSVGLAVGNRASDIAVLYPSASSRAGSIALVSYFYGAGFTEPALSALVAHKYVYALVAYGIPDE